MINDLLLLFNRWNLEDFKKVLKFLHKIFYRKLNQDKKLNNYQKIINKLLKLLINKLIKFKRKRWFK